MSSNNKQPIILDIETGALPRRDVLKFTKPYPPFDENEVKCGNIKDPDKIAEKIATMREAHATAEQSYYDNAIEKAALQAMTGCVLAVGVIEENEVQIIHNDEDEAELLARTWRFIRRAIFGKSVIIGWNVHGFDMRFLMQRSYINGVEVPEGVLENNRYWNRSIVDLMLMWNCGAYGQFAKLDDVSRAFGAPGKPEGVTGADFARLWSDPETRLQAISYLENDLRLTRFVARAMLPGLKWRTPKGDKVITTAESAVASLAGKGAA